MPSMRCEEIELPAYVERLCSPAQAREVEAHLADCDICRTVVATLVRSTSGGTAVHPESAVLELLADCEPSIRPGTQIGRYTIRERRGRGMMGEVFAAYDSELDRRVAIKFVGGRSEPRDPRARARLLREARTMARSTHPNIVGVHEVGAFDDRVFLVMELVEGPTLRRWQSQPDRTLADQLEAYRSAGRGLAAAHCAGIIHCDFKPDNVLVEGNGRVRVTDFGLARLTAVDSQPTQAHRHVELSEDELQATSVGGGTPAYMAPELLAGEPASVGSDVFSFCVALYEAVYGRLPFQPTMDPMALRAQTLTFPSDVETPPTLRAVLERGLSFNPNDRFGTVAEFLDDLEPVKSTRNRHRSAWAFAGLAVTSVAVFAAYSTDDVCARSTRLQDAAGTRSVEARAFADRWSAVRLESCRQTRVTKEYDEATLEVRTRCLDDLAQRFEAQLGEEARAGLQLLEIIGEPEQCLLARSRAGLDSRDPVLAASLDELRDAYDEQEFSRVTRYGRKVAEQARLAGEPLAEATALKFVGNAARTQGDIETADAVLQEAQSAALRANSAELDATIWIERAEIAGIDGHEAGRALGMMDAADAALVKASARASAVGVQALHTRGRLLSRLGRLDEALDAMQEARRLEVRLEGPFGPQLPAILMDLVAARIDRSGPEDLERARALLREAEDAAATRDHTGWNDIDRIRMLNQTGRIAAQQGDLVSAADALRRSIALARRALGEDHVDVSLLESNLASILPQTDAGRREAIELLRGAVRRLSQTHDPAFPPLVEMRTQLADRVRDQPRGDPSEDAKPSSSAARPSPSSNSSRSRGNPGTLDVSDVQ